MKQVSLDYTEDFSCLAGSCPDTCCKDWEIILDEDAISRYQKMPGVLGEQVRAAMTQTDEGETMWRLENGHCAQQRTMANSMYLWRGGALPHVPGAPALL